MIAPSTNRLGEDGFAIVPQVLTAPAVAELQTLLGPATGAGERGLLGRPEIRAWANSERLLDLIRPHLAHAPVPVRAIYFDKSAETNWLVPWHQDLTLALRTRLGVAGFGPWTVKDGIPHVQPPVELLGQMLTVRLHLDDADESNGALRVLPGSHRAGRLSAPAIQQYRAEQPEFLCTVSAGDAVLMRPLLLHASSRSTSARHRRVLHLEYAAFDLPPGLNWHEAA
jgi:hypothetical protein